MYIYTPYVAHLTTVDTAVLFIHHLGVVVYRDRSVCGGRNEEGVALHENESSDVPLVRLPRALGVLVVLELSAVDVVVHLREAGGAVSHIHNVHHLFWA